MGLLVGFDVQKLVPAGTAPDESRRIERLLGTRPLKQFWLPVIEEGCPQPDHFGGPIIEDEEDYKRVHKYLFTDRLLEQIDKNVGDYARAHADEDIAYWFSLDGFFWFPAGFSALRDICWPSMIIRN